MKIATISVFDAFHPVEIQEWLDANTDKTVCFVTTHERGEIFYIFYK